jgi:hypothetical protein
MLPQDPQTAGPAAAQAYVFSRRDSGTGNRG